MRDVRRSRVRRWLVIGGTGLLLSGGAVVGALGPAAAHADTGSGGSVTVETYTGSHADQIQLADTPAPPSDGDQIVPAP